MFRMKICNWKLVYPAAIGAALLLASGAGAQQAAGSTGNNSGDPSQPSELSVQVSGVFTRSTTIANAVNPTTVNKHIATNSAGLLVGYRYHFNSWEALEAEFGYTENGQRYYTPATAGGTSGAAYAITSRMYDLDANEVITTPRLLGFFQPFVLAGGGAIAFQPNSNPYGATTQWRPMFDYGAGLDFHIVHLGARIEYRGLIFKVPYFGLAALNTNKYTHIASPSIGLVLTW